LISLDGVGTIPGGARSHDRQSEGTVGESGAVVGDIDLLTDRRRILESQLTLLPIESDHRHGATSEGSDGVGTHIHIE